MLASDGSWDNNVCLWDVATGALTQTLFGHTKRIRSVVFSSDGATLASGSDDNTICLWDAVSGDHKRTLIGHKGGSE